MKIDMNLSPPCIRGLLKAINAYIGAEKSTNLFPGNEDDKSTPEGKNVFKLLLMVYEYLSMRLIEEDPSIAIGFTREEGKSFRSALQPLLSGGIIHCKRELIEKTILKLDILLGNQDD